MIYHLEPICWYPYPENLHHFMFSSDISAPTEVAKHLPVASPSRRFGISELWCTVSFFAEKTGVLYLYSSTSSAVGMTICVELIHPAPEVIPVTSQVLVKLTLGIDNHKTKRNHTPVTTNSAIDWVRDLSSIWWCCPTPFLDTIPLHQNLPFVSAQAVSFLNQFIESPC
ncbi:hypothetical protein DL98DRAFT_46717 [Cadophora sp. DSE1049]|nr:hypothetical protein DL98DRAFT_46717 [Cadophora sp. DSE1049]